MRTLSINDLLKLVICFHSFHCCFGISNWIYFQTNQCCGDCIREKSAILLGLPLFTSFKHLCEQTSASIDNYYFERPTRCESRHFLLTYGIFHVPDVTCCSIDTRNWMKILSLDKTFAQYTIPGTHDSCTNTAIGAYQCQGKSLSEQLDLGIRYFDIRCRLIDDSFAIHHSNVYLRMNFNDVQNIFKRFLISHPTEFLLVSVQKEFIDGGINRKTFEEVLQSYIDPFREFWYVNQTVPNIGNIQGKMILIRRNFNEISNIQGIHVKLQYNTKYYEVLNQTPQIYVQDNCCEILPFPELLKQKIAAYENLFERATNDQTSNWYLNSFNVAYNGIMPRQYAEILNLRLKSHLIRYANNLTLINNNNGRLGTIIMDFPENTQDLIKNIITLNLFDLRSAVKHPQIRFNQFYKQLTQTTSAICFDECAKNPNCTAISIQPINGDCLLIRSDQISSKTFDINFISFFKNIQK